MSLFNSWFNTYSDLNINYDELQINLLEQKFEEADRLTSSYLRKLAGKLGSLSCCGAINCDLDLFLNFLLVFDDIACL